MAADKDVELTAQAESVDRIVLQEVIEDRRVGTGQQKSDGALEVC